MLGIWNMSPWSPLSSGGESLCEAVLKAVVPKEVQMQTAGALLIERQWERLARQQIERGSQGDVLCVKGAHRVEI